METAVGCRGANQGARHGHTAVFRRLQNLWTANDICVTYMMRSTTLSNAYKNLSKWKTIHCVPEFIEYEKEFKAFCRRSVFECPNLIADYEPLYQVPLFVKLADEEFNNPSLSDLEKKFKTALATIIEVEPRHLVLLTYQDGCTQLIYSLPRAVAKKAFPLSQEQKEMLLKMGVLECCSLEYDQTDCTILLYTMCARSTYQSWGRTPYPWSPRLRGIIQLSRIGNVLQNIWLILVSLQFGVRSNRLHHSLVHHVCKKYLPKLRSYTLPLIS